MTTQIEIWFWQIAIWLIKRGYGCDCPTSDLDDFPLEQKMTPKEIVFRSSRCPSCKAKETIDWIKEHIELLKM